MQLAKSWHLKCFPFIMRQFPRKIIYDFTTICEHVFCWIHRCKRLSRRDRWDLNRYFPVWDRLPVWIFCRFSEMNQLFFSRVFESTVLSSARLFLLLKKGADPWLTVYPPVLNFSGLAFFIGEWFIWNRNEKGRYAPEVWTRVSAELCAASAAGTGGVYPVGKMRGLSLPWLRLHLLGGGRGLHENQNGKNSGKEGTVLHFTKKRTGIWNQYYYFAIDYFYRGRPLAENGGQIRKQHSPRIGECCFHRIGLFTWER